MAGLGDLVVKLSLDATGFSSGIDDAAYHAERSMAQIVAAGNIAATAITGFAKVAVEAVSATLQLLPQIAQGVFEQVDHLDEAAQSVGVSLQSFQQLQAAFALGGVGADQFATGLGKLNQAIVDASQGGKAADAFAKLGVAVTDANGELRDTESVLRDVAAAFKELPEGPERSALAVELFGKAGRQFIPTLSDDLDDLAEHAKAVGAVFSDDLVAAAHDYEQASAAVDQTQQGLKNTIAEGVLPVLADYKTAVDALVNELITAEERAQATELIQEGLRKAFNAVAYSVAFAVDVFVTLRDIFAEAAQAAQLFGDAMNTAKEAAQKALALDFSGARKELEDFGKRLEQFRNETQARLEREPLRFKVQAEIDKAQAAGDFKRDMEALAREFAPDRQDSRGEVSQRKQKAGRDTSADKEYQARLRLALQEGKAEEEAHKDMLRRTKQMDDEARREMERDQKEKEAAAHKHAKELADAATKAYEEQKRLNQQWEDLFVAPLADSFTALIDGSKSVAEAIADMAKSIAQSITQIVSHQVATGIIQGAFGGPDPASGGGIGGFFSGLFGTSGGARAFGGPFQAGQSILVGEQGPEWITPGMAGSVQPADNSSTTHNNISVNVRVPPVTDRRSADQMASSVGLAINRSLQRTQ